MSYRADKPSAYRTHRRTDERTDGHTDRQAQATTIPEGQKWPRVTTPTLFFTKDEYLYKNINLKGKCSFSYIFDKTFCLEFMSAYWS